ncbi:hypothetical protein MTQ12_06980 [Brevibacterium sp. R8603A2]|uniref:hypothetical protein n=1 Tax=Brevibacterium sp. R8603A2 TaxID=2929779 RepID=UPI001FF88459|nr:hypothetical protein [Brevibacterium sp. R8603A2]MCK1802797.1 hypothetical protein [Brevibacterium sp. R8603A2]
MTGSRFFQAAAAMSFLALLLVVFGGVSVLFVDVAFFIQAFALLAALAGIGLAISERLAFWGKPASPYLA